MATFVKFQKFTEDLLSKVHDLRAAGDTVRVYLTNATPNGATHTVKADIAEISAGSGYTAGGIDVQNDLTRTGGRTDTTGVNATFTASGGTIGPFRYAVLYNDTPTSPADPLIAYWDRGSEVTLADGESFQVQFTGGILFDLE
jgi:hypothetical protein